jgi:hypothetical protein
MQPSSIEQIDRAALILLRALAEHGDELAPYLEAGHVAALQEEITTLRRALLGLQMGPLYWEIPAESSDASSQESTGLPLDEDP